MSPRPDVSKERTNQILDAATNVFIRLGLHKARVDDIAKEAELSKGAVYWYFKSKDEIIIAILNRLFERELSSLRNLQNTGASASEQLDVFINLTVKDIRQWLRLIPVTYEFLGLIFRQAIVQKTFKQYLRSYMELLTPLIQQGIDAGEFRAADAKDVSLAIGALFEGTILLWVYDSESVDVEKHIRSSINLLMHGVLV